eukprot:CRZ04519.1 hypothetical protein [Spongospora subterranea]
MPDGSSQLQFDFSPPTSANSFVCPANVRPRDDDVGPVEIVIEDEEIDMDLLNFQSISIAQAPASLPFHISPANPTSFSSRLLAYKPHLDDFVLLSFLGQGAYGKVYLVSNNETNEVFAMKCMKKADIVKQNVVNYAHHERSVLIAASHPFIVHLRYAFQTPQKLYLILDYIPGGELFSRLNAENFFLESMAVFYSAEIVCALSHLHTQDIIYRDLKPENLMIHSDGHICLTDFGLAKRLDVNGTQTMCGTLAYLAPEVISKKVPYGKPADWWSLGVLLYEMLSGRIPFDSANRNTLQKKIMNQKLSFPKHITNTAKSILKKLLCRDPSARLGSSGDEQVKTHPFFASIKWGELEKKLITPPFIPDLTGPTDTRHFDLDITSRPLHSPTDEKSSFAESFQDHFKGFSFAR